MVETLCLYTILNKKHAVTVLTETGVEGSIYFKVLGDTGRSSGAV